MVVLPRNLRRAARSQSTRSRVLLACGIAAPMLSVIIDVLAGLRYPGYSFVSRSVSDLSAIGAPTRQVVMPLELVADGLMLAFGLGAWTLAGYNRALRIAADLVMGNAAVSIVAVAFFPASLGEAGSAAPSTTGVVLGAVGVICFVLAITLGAAAYRTWFRAYSVGTLATYLMLTILGLWRPFPLFTGPPGSTVGIQERTMILGYLLWMVLLATSLLRAPLLASGTALEGQT